MNWKRLSLVAGLGLLMLLGCRSPLQDGYGQLVVSFGFHDGARLLQPDFDLEPESYVLVGSGPDGTEFEVTAETSPVKVPGLVFGSWTVRVYARNADRIVIAEGMGTTEVHVAHTSFLSVPVTPLEGFGSLELTVQWNSEDTDEPAIEASLASPLPMDLEFQINDAEDTGTWSGSGIPTGYHALTLKLLDSGVPVIGAVEVVRIVKDQVTRGLFRFPWINKGTGELQVEITPEMEDPILVTLSGVPDELPAGGSLSADVSVPAGTGEVRVDWYLNAQKVGTGDSLALAGLEPGTYRLDVIVFSEDEPRAGSASKTFQVREFDNTNITGFVWSPDGQRIAFTKSPTGSTANCDLWVADRDLRNANLIRSGVAAYGSLDWQGDWILFTPDLEEGLPSSYYGSGEYFKIHPDGTGETQLTYTFSNGIRTVFWDPDPWYKDIGTCSWARFVPGTGYLYFVAHDGNGWYSSYRCNADGSDGWVQVSEGNAWRAAVSPLGKLLYAHSLNYNTPVAIYSVNPELTDRRLVKENLPPLGFLVSRDGQRAAWGTGGEVYSIRLDGTDERRATNDAYEDWLAGPGEDGEHLLIISPRGDGNNHVFSVSVNGGEPVQLTFGSYDQGAAALSPAGNWLACLRVPEDYVYPGSGVTPYALAVKLLE